MSLATGAILGVLYVWMQRPEPAPCTTTNGMPVCMPVYVQPLSLWVYLAFGTAGALAALLAAGAALHARRRVN